MLLGICSRPLWGESSVRNPKFWGGVGERALAFFGAAGTESPNQVGKTEGGGPLLVSNAPRFPLKASNSRACSTLREDPKAATVVCSLLGRAFFGSKELAIRL